MTLYTFVYEVNIYYMKDFKAFTTTYAQPKIIICGKLFYVLVSVFFLPYLAYFSIKHQQVLFLYLKLKTLIDYCLCCCIDHVL